MAKTYDIKEVRLSVNKFTRGASSPVKYTREASSPVKVFEDRPPVFPYVVEFYLFDPRKNDYTDIFIVSAVDEMDAFVKGTKRIERYKK